MSTKVINQSQSFPTGDTFIPASGASAPGVVPAGVSSADLSMSAGPMPGATQYFDGRVYLDRLDGNGFVAVAGLAGGGGSFPPNQNGTGTPVAQTLSLGSQHFALRPGMRYYIHVVVTGGPIQASVSLTLN